MNTKRFLLLKKEIENILIKSPIDFELMHSRLVLRYVLKLKPTAGEALKVAAIAHDIERAVTGITERDLKDYSKIDQFKKDHALRSAKIAAGLLKKYNYQPSLIKRVVALIKKHEVGGGGAEALKDADSLAFFDYNIPFYLKRNGPERTFNKIQFMYSRLSSRGKKMVQRMKFKNKRIKNIVHDVAGEIKLSKFLL